MVLKQRSIWALFIVAMATGLLMLLAWPTTTSPVTPEPQDPGAGFSTSPPSSATPSDPRVVVPLLLTHVKYHGTSLLATTIQGWILKLFIPQGNMDLLLFYDEDNAPLGDIVKLLRLAPAERPPTVSEDEHEKSKPVFYFTAPHISRSFVIQALPVRLPLPKYAQRDPSIVDRIYNDSTWMKCGCPPYCPPRRATVHYVQGTRWYTAQMFQERGGLIERRYQYWVKLDVDIWIFRPPPFNLGREMASKPGVVVAHTGYAYNGHGCSNELKDAIGSYCTARAATKAPCPLASADDPFWRQDDNVYYSNFIMSSVAFHARGLRDAVDNGATPFGLAAYLNEYPTGFFKYRWTDQSLFHKVIGVFAGPREAHYALDWSELRCDKKKFHPGAIFWHSKKHKTAAELRRCTHI